ncbi:hypothetical protein DFH09DRAFT_1324567 [Mycena vulgaris]|nr:hypothetical protein DFH09DRAFT_1324567 [Mycena vulgaris]
MFFNALSNTEDFRYVRWFGEVTIPIINAHRGLIALLGGKPKDLIGWKIVTDAAAELMARLMQQGHFSDEQLHHRCARSLTRQSHEEFLMVVGNLELCNNKSNTKISDELLASVWFQRISDFTMCLFMTFGPMLFAFFLAQMTLLADWDPLLQWPFLGSIFAACTFNFGPHMITVSHLNFGNLSWGWCTITALRNFDLNRGGHLILWDLKLIIQFPPGSMILIPSVLIRHSNIHVLAHERQYSFTQYTAGGLFQWIQNGFKTDEDFEATATKAEKAAHTLESKTQWEEGVKMFSIIDDFV